MNVSINPIILAALVPVLASGCISVEAEDETGVVYDDIDRADGAAAGAASCEQAEQLDWRSLVNRWHERQPKNVGTMWFLEGKLTEDHAGPFQGLIEASPQGIVFQSTRTIHNSYHRAIIGLDVDGNETLRIPGVWIRTLADGSYLIDARKQLGASDYWEFKKYQRVAPDGTVLATFVPQSEADVGGQWYIFEDEDLLIFVGPNHDPGLIFDAWSLHDGTPRPTSGADAWWRERGNVECGFDCPQGAEFEEGQAAFSRWLEQQPPPSDYHYPWELRRVLIDGDGFTYLQVSQRSIYNNGKDLVIAVADDGMEYWRRAGRFMMQLTPRTFLLSPNHESYRGDPGAVRTRIEGASLITGESEWSQTLGTPYERGKHMHVGEGFVVFGSSVYNAAGAVTEIYDVDTGEFMSEDELAPHFANHSWRPRCGTVKNWGYCNSDDDCQSGVCGCEGSDDILPDRCWTEVACEAQG